MPKVARIRENSLEFIKQILVEGVLQYDQGKIKIVSSFQKLDLFDKNMGRDLWEVQDNVTTAWFKLQMPAVLIILNFRLCFVGKWRGKWMTLYTVLF